jgi:hypothetical protein
MVNERRLYWVFTGLLAVLMVGSASQQVLDHAWAVESFARLGFPAWLIYPLSAAKLLGVAAVITGVSPFLKSLAYAGFFYHLSLALSAHIAVGDGPDMMVGAVAGLVLLAGSFHFNWVFR